MSKEETFIRIVNIENSKLLLETLIFFHDSSVNKKLFSIYFN